jgi:hypothetical protein
MMSIQALLTREARRTRRNLFANWVVGYACIVNSDNLKKILRKKILRHPY